MLDQLVESKSHGEENKKRGGYLLTTFTLIAGLLFSAVLWSLFAKDLGMGREGFELRAMVAPLPVNANAPEPAQKEPKREQSQNTKSGTISRRDNMLRVDELQPAPVEISVVPNTQKARPNEYSLISDTTAAGWQNSSDGETGRLTKESGIGIQNPQPTQIETAEKTIPPPPPPIKKPTTEPVEKGKTIVSDGVINGQATFLPKPPYPPAAKAIHVGGNVSVQVTIDETGRVISAKAIDGHFLLRPAAEKAAWDAKFNPTLLSRQPVKVSGVIVYKFAVQ